MCLHGQFETKKALLAWIMNLNIDIRALRKVTKKVIYFLKEARTSSELKGTCYGLG